MHISFLHIVFIWFAVVVALLLIAGRAKRRFIWTAASVAAIIISGAPALIITWTLVSYLTGDRGLLYGEGPPKPSDFSLLDWAIFSVPGIATVLGVGVLVRRWKGVANVQDE